MTPCLHSFTVTRIAVLFSLIMPSAGLWHSTVWCPGSSGVDGALYMVEAMGLIPHLPTIWSAVP
jgi:hypothetical protein